jgi:hypothetical protein
VVDGIPVCRVSVHPEASANRELADYDNPLAGRLLRRFLDAQAFDLVHVFHARNIGTAAITEPLALGIPVVVNLMDFWFLCPNFLLLHSSGALCDGPPEGGLGCVPCMNQTLNGTVRDRDLAESLLALAAERASPGAGMRAAGAHALVGRKRRLFAVLGQAQAVVAPSQFVKSVFERNGFDPRRLIHVPYGVDTARLKGLRPRVADGTLAIGFIGSIAPHKGLHVAVEAVRGLHDPRCRLHVHGNLQTHTEYAARVTAAARDDPRIVFHGGFAPTELATVLSGLDCVVVPSLWYENTPFTVLEALAARKPVVASNHAGMAEIVNDGGNGLLFEAGRADRLRAAFSRLLNEPDLLPALTPTGQARTVEDNVGDFLVLYETIADARRGEIVR